MRCGRRQRRADIGEAVEDCDALLRTAALLAGSRADGEDLLQSALERLLRNWRRIDGDPENYVRRTLYNLATDGWRRQRVWRQKAALFEPAPAVDPSTAVDLRDAVVGVLAQLPPRQRAVLVLRSFEQLSEAETAQTLGCSVGTVKSATARGLSPATSCPRLAGDFSAAGRSSLDQVPHVDDPADLDWERPEPSTSESGAATSSKDLPSAFIPNAISTSPPMIMIAPPTR